MKPLEIFDLHYGDRLRAARAWKARGGKVVGYLCDNVPDELISAAGFFPLRVSGDPTADMDAVRTKVDRLYSPEVSNRPAFVASILNQLVSGAYDLLDYLVIPHNRNAIQAIFRELKDACRADPSIRAPVLHYLDKAWSPYFTAEVYNRDRVLEFRDVLEGWAGQPISDAALAEAMAVGAENRRLLTEVASLRASSPPRLSGVQALRIIGTSMVMPKADHSAALKALLADARSMPERSGRRLFLGGSPQDHDRIYEAIESTGATIVAEDHCWGARAFETPGLGSPDPILALASRFHSKPACSILFPIAETRTACVRRAAAASADAAIFYVMAEDWAQNWETPGQVRALEATGIPCLHLKKQSYEAVDTEALRFTVAAFLEGLTKRVQAPAEVRA